MVMMALAASFGFGASASAQTPSQSGLIGLLKRGARPVAVSAPVLQPVGGTSLVTPNTVKPPLIQPLSQPTEQCGPRPPRPI
jgi:hypothetical protein